MNANDDHDNTEAQKRKKTLGARLDNDHTKYFRLGRLNYFASLAIRWLAAGAGLVAGILGLTNAVSAAVVGGIAAVAGLLLAFGRDLRFQQKANWHYRRAEGTDKFKIRLDFQLPASPTVDDIASVADDYSKFSAEMTQQWEAQIAVDDTARPPPPNP